MRSIWFQDNIGNVLICIEIERNTAPMHWFIRWYRYTERCVNWACQDRGAVEKVILLVAVFAWAVICLAYSLIHMVIVYWPLSAPLLAAGLTAWLVYRRKKRKRAIRENAGPSDAAGGSQ